jgi:hypothetical protein
MTNNFGGQGIWHMDTAASVLSAGAKIKLKKLVWYPNAADNDLDVQDANGESIMKCRAQIPSGATRDDIGKIVEDFGDGQWFDGFNLVTIDGGVLDVYHK